MLAIIVASAFLVASLYAKFTWGDIPSEEDQAVDVALDFLRNGATYRYDGIDGTMKVEEVRILESYPIQYVVIVTFDSRHAGYGDRTGEFLAQVITRHTANVKVVENEVVQAVLDNYWDELNQQEVCPSEYEPHIIVMSPKTARDLAIEYVIRFHEEAEGLEPPSSWRERDLTPVGWLGSSKRQFLADDWNVNVSWAVVRYPVYTVEIEYTGEVGFFWEGMVEEADDIDEIEFKLID